MTWPPTWDKPHFKEPGSCKVARGLNRKDRKRVRASVPFCKECGKPNPVSQPSHGHTFCSTKCLHTNRSRGFAEKRGKCRQCGGQVNYRGCRYCSLKCAQAARLMKRPPCRHCGKTVTAPVNRFCSRKCLNAHEVRKWAQVEMPCVRCGKTVTKVKSQLKSKRRTFCSTECKHLFMVGKEHPHWRGDVERFRGDDWRRLVKQIRARDDNRCRRCGVERQANGISMSVDHVIPWRMWEDKKAANDPSNLVSLCSACHAFKTTVIERAYLRGDMQAFAQFRRDIEIDQTVSLVGLKGAR